jgi:hypothetical protein
MRCVALIAVCWATAGCAASAPTPRHAPLASKACTGVAQQRADDAAANGIEPAMQRVMRWQDKAVLTSGGTP